MTHLTFIIMTAPNEEFVNFYVIKHVTDCSFHYSSTTHLILQYKRLLYKKYKEFIYYIEFSMILIYTFFKRGEISLELGELIKSKRKDLGLTQKDLADGICAQALISRIENGDVVPRKSILNKIEDRLLFERDELRNVDRESKREADITKVKKAIRKYLYKRDYETIELLLDHHRFSIESIRDVDDSAFFTWIEASLQHQLYKKHDQSLDLFQSIPLDKISDELSIEIINAIGIIYYQRNDYKQAIEIYEKGVKKINDSVNFQIRAKIMLNYALALEQDEKNKEALSYISSGIDLLVEHNSLYLLGDFHHTKGHLFHKLGNLSEAKYNFELSLTLFKLQSNNRFASFSQLALTEISNQLKK